MWTVYIGTLIPGVKDHLTEFYDRPFEVFGSYYDTGLYRMPWDFFPGVSRKEGMGRGDAAVSGKSMLEGILKCACGLVCPRVSEKSRVETK